MDNETLCKKMENILSQKKYNGRYKAERKTGKIFFMEGEMIIATLYYKKGVGVIISHNYQPGVKFILSYNNIENITLFIIDNIKSKSNNICGYYY